MSTEKITAPSRREVLQATGGLAATAMLSGLRFPNVHPGGADMIQVALVGCGGRGSGAAGQALSTKGGPIKLVAMADAFPDRLKSSYDNLHASYAALMDVPEERAQAWRHRHLDDPARIPMGPFPVCDLQEVERVHGETGHGRWSDEPKDAEAGRPSDGGESQSRRRLNVEARAKHPATP